MARFIGYELHFSSETIVGVVGETGLNGGVMMEPDSICKHCGADFEDIGIYELRQDDYTEDAWEKGYKAHSCVE